MITREEVSKSLNQLTDDIRTELVKMGLKAFDALTEEEREKLSSGQSMRFAKILIQVIASGVIDDYNHEAVKIPVKTASRILNRRVW